MDGQTSRHAVLLMNRQVDRQRGGQAGGQADKLDRHTDGQTGGGRQAALLMNIQTDRWTHQWISGQTGSSAHEHTDGHTDRQLC